MLQERTLIHSVFDGITDYSWSPFNIIKVKGEIYPQGLTPGEARVCRGLSLVFSGTRMAGVIQFLYGPEARNMYEEKLRKLEER